MMNGFNLLAGIFSSSQIFIIVLVSLALAMLIALNAVLMYMFHKSGERKLCTHQLQQKREELLEKLEFIKNGGEVESSVSGWLYPVDELQSEETAEGDFDEIDADECDDDEDGETVLTDNEDLEEAQDPDDVMTEILAVRDMSEGTRAALGFIGEMFDRKRYYVRYTFGFDAKLRAADDVIKQRYKEFVTEIMLYKGVKIKGSFRQQRILKGRKTLGLIMFRGKTLCIAFALNPADYAETKYRGIDKSDKKRFADTPMLYKLTSARRLEYAKYLLVQIADDNTIIMTDKPVVPEFDLEEKTRDELFLNKSLRINIMGEAPDLEEEDTDDGDEIIVEIPEFDDTVETETPEEGGRGNRLTYNRSFTARIIQANDELKARYSELKNYVLGYQGVSSVISWKREAFRIKGKNAVVFAISGKTLCLYFALDPADMEGTKYGTEDVSDKRSSGNTPVMLRIKSDRRTKYAKELIDTVLTNRQSFRIDRKPVDYTTPYKATATLVRKGMIREKVTRLKLPQPNVENTSENADKEN